MIHLVAFAFAQAAAPHAAPPAGHPVMAPKPVVSGADTCLPLRFADGMPVIAATIQGRPVSLGFDTGAPGGPILDPAVIAELKLARAGEARLTDPSFRNVVSVPLHALDGMKVGNIAIGKWVASSRPHRESRRLAEPDGIIGLTAFAGYVVTIDYPAGRILFTKGRLAEPDGRTSFRYQGPIPRVPLSVDGQAIDAHIDTGNSRYSLLVPESFAAKLPSFASRFPIGIARSINNSFDLVAVPIRESKVGDFPLHAGTVAFPGPAARGNVGSPILRDMVVKVDPANSIVALERAVAPLGNGCPSA